MLSENRDKYQPNNNTNICNIPITERHFYGCLPYGLSQWRLLVITDAQPCSEHIAVSAPKKNTRDCSEIGFQSIETEIRDEFK